MEAAYNNYYGSNFNGYFSPIEELFSGSFPNVTDQETSTPPPNTPYSLPTHNDAMSIPGNYTDDSCRHYTAPVTYTGPSQTHMQVNMVFSSAIPQAHLPQVPMNPLFVPVSQPSGSLKRPRGIDLEENSGSFKKLRVSVNSNLGGSQVAQFNPILLQMGPYVPSSLDVRHDVPFTTPLEPSTSSASSTSSMSSAVVQTPSSVQKNTFTPKRATAPVQKMVSVIPNKEQASLERLQDENAGLKKSIMKTEAQKHQLESQLKDLKACCQNFMYRSYSYDKNEYNFHVSLYNADCNIAYLSEEVLKLQKANAQLKTYNHHLLQQMAHSASSS